MKIPSVSSALNSMKQVTRTVGHYASDTAKTLAKAPMKKLGLPILIAGMTLGGGGVALAHNNKKADSFQKTELLAQKKQKTKTQEFSPAKFNEWIANVVKNQKTTPLSEMKPFSYEGNKESKMGQLTALTYQDIEEYSANPKLSDYYYAGEIVEVFKLIGFPQANIDELKESVLQDPKFIAEFKAFDISEDGLIEAAELSAKYRFLDELDGVRDKKISAESYIKTDYSKPEIKAKIIQAVRAIFKDMKEGTE